MINSLHKEALILGFGRSGRAAARLLQQQGWNVRAVDESLTAASRMDPEGVERLRLSDGGEGLPKGDFALAVVSPGVALDHPWIVQCQDRGIPLVSELELGAFFCRGKILAITGSNGKTTLVEFCREAIEAQGWSVLAVGNIGYPLSDAVLDAPETDWLVVEVSSFQLEHVVTLRPEVAVLINVLPNHLDRHGDMETYAATKLRLFRNMRGEDRVVLPDTLPYPVDFLSEMPPEISRFGLSDTADYQTREHAVYRYGRRHVDLKQSYFDHPTYAVNVAAACAALDAVGVTKANQQAALRTFRGRAHRFEKLGIQQGVEWINDSKSTNLAATAAALEACPGRVHLIAGGVLKENDLKSLKEVLVRKVACVYLMGAATRRMLEAWSPEVACISCETLDCAVDTARRRAVQGEQILLSPGCASFDQFSGYEERGEAFRKKALETAKEKAT